MAPKAAQADEEQGALGAAVGGLKNVGGAAVSGVKAVGEGAVEGAKAVGGAVAGGAKAAGGSGALLAQGEGAKALGAYDRMFYKHINLQFGDDLELAFRAAFFVWVVGVPFFLPAWLCPPCQQAIATKFVSSGSVIYFMFTLYKTTGDTINFAIGGFLGTCIAVVNIWLMMGFMPGGYHGPDDKDGQWIWWAGMAWGATYVWMLLWLNLDANTQVFGLSTYVFYWMAFINYHVATGFSQNFTIRYDGAAVRELAVASTGIGIAIIAGFVPYPMFAMRRAHKTGKTLVFQLHSTWTDFCDYYSGEERNAYTQAMIGKKLNVMKALVGTLQGYIGSSWYECFGMGPWQKQRMMLKKLDSYMSESFNRLSCVLNSCLSEDFNDTHDKLMAEVRENMCNIVESVGGLLIVIIQTVQAGDATATKADLQKRSEELKLAVRELTVEFLKAQKNQNPPLDKVSDDCAGENVVCSNICAFSRLTCEFAAKLQEPMPAEVGGGIKAIFDPGFLTDPMHLNFVFRNWLSILCSFWVGYKGVAGKMIMPYNASLACTCCLLLSRFIGSAMGKNLNRLQGVVLGGVMGQTAYALLAWCVWWGYVSVAIAVVTWATLTLFIYYNSVQYSTVGLLLAVFGVSSLLQGCSDEVYDPSTSYYGIINTTGGICIMCVVDTIFAPGRASDMAVTKYFAPWDMLVKQSEQLFDPEIKTLPARKGALRGMIADAAAMGGEAYEEPRYWRVAWPTSTYDRAVGALSTLRFTLASLESGVTNVKTDGRAEKEEHFIAALKLSSFGDIRTLLKRRFEATKIALEKALQNETGETLMSFTKSQQLSSDIGEMEAKTNAAIEAFVKEFNSQKFREIGSDGTLEDDPVADMSILVTSLQAIFNELEAVNREMNK